MGAGIRMVILLILFLGPYGGYNHYARALRPFVLLLRKRQMRNLYIGICDASIRTLFISLVIFIFIGAVGFISFIIYRSEEYLKTPGYFGSLGEACWNWYIGHTIP